MSEDWLSARLDRQIDKVSRVDQIVLGTRVVGQARTVGRPTLELLEQKEIASFDVVFQGNTISRTVGNPGPVTIRSRSETSFTAKKRVLFESGKGFYTLPAEIDAQTRVVTESISPNRCLGHRIVSRRAWEEVNAKRPVITQLAKANAESRINQAFDEKLELMLARLNRMADFRMAVAGLTSGTSAPSFLVHSTKHYVEIAAAVDSESEQFVPPAIGNLDAPIQLWIHRSLVPQQFASGAIGAQRAGLGLEGVAHYISSMLSDKSAGNSGPKPAQPAIKYQFIDDWIALSLSDLGPTK